MYTAYAQDITTAVTKGSSVSGKDIFLGIGIATIISALIYIGRKLQTLDTIVSTTDKIKKNVSVMSNFLIKNTDFDPSELQSFSPFKLTDIGLKRIQESGFETIFNDNKKDFFEFIDKEKPKLKYDVEIAAIKSIYALYDKEYMNFLKIDFYNNPKRTMEKSAPTFGIYVRDKYLSEHPEIVE